MRWWNYGALFELQYWLLLLLLMVHGKMSRMQEELLLLLLLLLVLLIHENGFIAMVRSMFVGVLFFNVVLVESVRLRLFFRFDRLLLI